MFLSFYRIYASVHRFMFFSHNDFFPRSELSPRPFHEALTVSARFLKVNLYLLFRM